MVGDASAEVVGPAGGPGRAGVLTAGTVDAIQDALYKSDIKAHLQSSPNAFLRRLGNLSLEPDIMRELLKELLTVMRAGGE
jgi:hypothetical protein